MNKKTTSSSLLRGNGQDGMSEKNSTSVMQQLTPSEKTLAFLRTFARNYRVIPQLPRELQGLLLS